MVRPYPGDIDQKRIARAIMYTRLCHMWQPGGQWPDGKIITLVGDGAEINLLRYFMRASPKNVVFIDKDKKAAGLDRAAREWKRATTVSGNILQYLRSMRDDIAFINLDFNGHFKVGSTEKILEEAGKRLADGGALSFTFTRGHESKEFTKHWQLLKYHAIKHVKETGEALTDDKNLLRDEIRFRGYQHLIQEILGEDIALVLKLKYSRHRGKGMNQGGKSLGVLMFQYVPEHLRTTNWLKTFRSHRFEEERTGRVKSQGVKDRLREFVFWGASIGLSSKEIGGLLNLRARTIGAYKANASRKVQQTSAPPAPAINVIRRVDGGAHPVAMPN